MDAPIDRPARPLPRAALRLVPGLLLALAGLGSPLAAAAADDPPPLAPVQDPAPTEPPPTPLVVSIAAAPVRDGS